MMTNQSETTDVRKVCSQRGKIENTPGKLKQLPGIEPCLRKARIQTNHIACGILFWSFIKRAHLIGKTIYQLKSELLSEHLKNEVKYPVIR
jgi:hypothetical protein